MYEVYIQKIMDSANPQKIKELGDIFKELISEIKESHKEIYDKIETKLYEISEGKILNEEKAKEIIMKMKPVGMKWTLEETEQVRNNYGYTTIMPVDFWIVMNSAYNDYKDIFNEDIDKYAMFSYAFINDEDGIDDKVYEYFTKIAK